MSETISTDTNQLERAIDTLLLPGRSLFALAILALGIEFLCTGSLVGTLIKNDWVGRILGPILAACAVGLFFKRTLRTSALTMGTLLFAYTLVFEVPIYAAALGNMSFRTRVFEPLSLATLAWLLPGRHAVPTWLERAGRYLLALSLIVFGVDHFLALAPIGTLVPQWIPWHVFWIAFFGAGFIAAGLSIGFDLLLRWGAAGIGLMFAIWVFTLHLPRTLFGFSGGAGPHSRDEWSSSFIAIALWGGSWALAGARVAAHCRISAAPTATAPKVSSDARLS
jgi:hypothetical protein